MLADPVNQMLPGLQAVANLCAAPLPVSDPDAAELMVK